MAELATLYKSGLLRKILLRYNLVSYKEQIDDNKYWVNFSWQNCLEKLNIDADICFYGHSQIRGSNFNEYFKDKKIVNLGLSGDDIKGMTRRIGQIKAVNPNKIFLMAGVNSLGYSNELFESSYKELIHSIIKSNPKSKLYVFNILPQRDGELGKTANNKKIIQKNLFIQQYCHENDIPYIDLFSLYIDENNELKEEFSSDGLHLKTSAYKIWAEAIEQYVE